MNTLNAKNYTDVAELKRAKKESKMLRQQRKAKRAWAELPE